MQYISTSARQIAENDTQCEISYGPPEDDFSIPPPDNQLVKSIFPGDKFHFSPTRPYYVSIPDGFILNPEGAVLTDTSTPLNESMNGIINRYTQSSIHSIVNHIKSKRSDSVRHIDNTVMPLHNVFQGLSCLSCLTSTHHAYTIKVQKSYDVKKYSCQFIDHIFIIIRNFITHFAHRLLISNG